MSNYYMSKLTSSFGVVGSETRIFQEKPYAFNHSAHECLRISEAGDVFLGRTRNYHSRT